MRFLIATIVALVASSSAFAAPGRRDTNRPRSIGRSLEPHHHVINQYPTFQPIQIPPELSKKWTDEYNRIQKAVFADGPEHAEEHLKEHEQEIQALQNEMTQWDLHSAHP
jgi:hypothetical protein